MNEETAVQIVPAQPPTVADMLKAVVDRGVTTENVSALKEMVGLYERMQDREAEKEFTKAFVRLQSEIKDVVADKAVPADYGGWTYCSYEEISAQILPAMTRNGFAVRFSQDSGDGRVIVTCFLMHEGGHTVSNFYKMRTGSATRGRDENKMDSSASTIAQREAFCDALNIKRRGREEDARYEGGTITPEQAASLAKRVTATGSDASAFLKFAGAATFDEISAVKFDMLDDLLKRKEKKK